MADDLQRLEQDLQELADGLQDQRLLRRIGLSVERRVRQRTRQGVDFEDSPFQDYSESYAKKRERKDLPTDKVNLQYTLYGGSMEQLDHVIARDLSGVEVLFATERAEDIMRYHNVEGAGESKVIRQNMGVTEEDIDEIEDLVGQHIDDLLSIHDLK